MILRHQIPVMRQDIVAKSGSLDVPSAVTWWHRNVAKAGYGLQGWLEGDLIDWIEAKC
jgi:hypothetical protein